MRSVWCGLLCAGIFAGWSASAAAAEGVRVWVPTPVKAADHKAAAVKTDVRVGYVAVFGRKYCSYRYRCLTSRDWWLDGSPSGYTKVYSGPLYPF